MDDCDWLLSVGKVCDWLRIEPGVRVNFFLGHLVFILECHLLRNLQTRFFSCIFFQSEIEKADFDKLLAKLERTNNIPEVLKEMLLSLKESGQPKPGCLKPRPKFSKNQNIFDFL